jgi:hypothetical protein
MLVLSRSEECGLAEAHGNQGSKKLQRHGAADTKHTFLTAGWLGMKNLQDRSCLARIRRFGYFQLSEVLDPGRGPKRKRVFLHWLKIRLT